jgi:hypothetical protein
MRQLLLATAVVVALGSSANAQLAFSDLGSELTATGTYDFLISYLVQQCPLNCGTDSVCLDVCQAEAPIEANNSGVHLDAAAVGTAMCTNRGNQGPPKFSKITLPQTLSASGTSGPPLSNSVTTAPPMPVAGAPDCPAPKGQGGWVETITDLAFESATLTYFSADNLPIVSCTFTPPSQNGDIPASQVNCIEKQ